MTPKTPNPGGCALCGVDKRDHYQHYTDEDGGHGWTQPTQDLIKARMLARRTTA